MSSTSHEVCELWNGIGVVRTLGEPEIKEIIYLADRAKDEKTLGLYSLESLKEELERCKVTEGEHEVEGEFKCGPFRLRRKC